MTEDEITAFEEGRAAGRSKNAFAGDCPFPHSQPNLRQAWMDGFGQERHYVVKRVAADEAGKQGEPTAAPNVRADQDGEPAP